MKVIGVIPARYGSTRFKGKVLAEIAGKPMVQHVWERVKQCSLIDELIIACDDERVYKAAVGFGAKAMMTSRSHETGTDRIVEIVKDLNVHFVVNIQGDEPLISPKVIDTLVHCLKMDDQAQMATVIKQIEDRMDFKNPNVVKVVVDCKNFALYFSRSAIPFDRDAIGVKGYKHIGLYAYRKECLLGLAQMPQTTLELTEKLEQLRALENGIKIKTVLTDSDTVGVDTPEDLIKVEQMLKNRIGL